MTSGETAYDYIIVGAGSAGCVLAARLTEDPKVRVLLLEAGGHDRAKEIQIPAAFTKLFKTSVDWNYSTDPESHLHGRKLYWPRGKMLGGSSSMNAMMYVRGNRKDYDHWESLGNDGWGFADVLPYFKKSECQQRGASEYHGVDGPLKISDLRYVNPLTKSFLEAAEELGYAPNPDFNGVTQDGSGLHQVTQKDGRRHSASGAFLKPALRRSNLTLKINAHTTRIIVEKQRAIALVYSQDGSLQEARADREILIAGGTVNSPQLLLLSGIGSAEEIRAQGIRVIHDLPGVGKNLQDHLMVSVGYVCRKPVTMAGAETLPNLLRYLFLKSGMLVSNVAEAGIFVRTTARANRPDLQLLFGPAYYVNHGLTQRKDHCFGFGPTLITPESRGIVSLRSPNPFDAPLIHANYLSTGSDLRVMIAGAKLAREIAHTKPFDPFRGEEIHPGAAINREKDWEEFIRNEAQTLYHPVGTCKMGNDAMAVVDSRLQVRGIEGLRVVDASIMPRIIAGNTNAATMMIAEKAADMIVADGT